MTKPLTKCYVVYWLTILAFAIAIILYCWQKEEVAEAQDAYCLGPDYCDKVHIHLLENSGGIVGTKSNEPVCPNPSPGLCYFCEGPNEPITIEEEPNDSYIFQRSDYIKDDIIEYDPLPGQVDFEARIDALEEKHNHQYPYDEVTIVIDCPCGAHLSCSNRGVEYCLVCSKCSRVYAFAWQGIEYYLNEEGVYSEPYKEICAEPNEPNEMVLDSGAETVLWDNTTTALSNYICSKCYKDLGKIAAYATHHICGVEEPNAAYFDARLESLESRIWKCSWCTEHFETWKDQQHHMLYFCEVLHPPTEIEQRIKALEGRLQLKITDGNDIYQGGYVFSLPNNKCLVVFEEGEQE